MSRSWRMLFILTFFVAMLTDLPPALAGEPDDAVAHAALQKLDPSKTANVVLNQTLNRLIEQATEDANLLTEFPKGPRQPCDNATLIRRFADVFDRNFPAIYGPISDSANAFYVGSQNHKDSPAKAFIIQHKRMWAPTFPVLTRSGVHAMGLDKIDHFFSHGYLLWLTLKNIQEPTDHELNKALEPISQQEDSSWGLKSTGVKSYADIAAAYLGLKFWQTLIDGQSPLLRCENGRFTQTRDFDLFRHLDASVDESFNCNSYKSETFWSGLKKAHHDRAIELCPMRTSSTTCSALAQGYPIVLQKRLFHPRCFTNTASQVEEPSALTANDVLELLSASSGITNLIPFWWRAENATVPVSSSPAEPPILTPKKTAQ